MKLALVSAVVVSAAVGAGVAGVIASSSNSAAPTTTVVRRVTEVTGGTPASFSGSLSVAQIYKQSVPAVVEIKAVTSAGGSPFGGSGATEEVQGTGFVIDTHGDIVTNDHVVAGGHSITVTIDGGHTFPATIVGQDPSTDVAVIKINAPASDLHPLTFADSSTVQVGDGVVAIGDPFGLSDTTTAGIVSAVGRTIQSPNNRPIFDAIQTDAAINHGNSGGPLLNAAGQVIGITSQIDTGGNASSGNVGIGFAVPSNTVKQVVDQIISTGHASHPYLGVDIETVSPALSKATGLPVGVEVVKVMKNSPASKVGLRAATTQSAQAGGFPTGGDVITAVNGQAIKSDDQLIQKITALKPGDKVSLTVVRGSKTLTIQVTLGNLS
ncbi:MAG TPA: trypsin-like peptidase domain-containing protein [Thermoleophilia bacterium]|nr:trypsin-like peptidase domain-containing protein [Thermoleophilia bacterium]